MSKPRSTDQHRRFFGVISALYSHWPESHAFQPDSAEHLRAWLLCRAGYRNVTTFHLEDDAGPLTKLVPMIFATVLQRHAWCWGKGNELYVCVPQSIAFDKMDHKTFCKVCDDVDEVIRLETGLDPDQLLRETEAAA